MGILLLFKVELLYVSFVIFEVVFCMIIDGNIYWQKEEFLYFVVICVILYDVFEIKEEKIMCL